MVKGDLDWQYLGWFGNTGHKEPGRLRRAMCPYRVGLDNDGHFFVGDVPSDTFKNLRAADATTGQWLWTLWGNSSMPGAALTVAGDGLLYLMRNMQGQGMCVTCLQPTSGKVVMEGSQGGQILLKEGATFTGWPR